MKFTSLVAMFILLQDFVITAFKSDMVGVTETAVPVYCFLREKGTVTTIEDLKDIITAEQSE